MANVKLNIYILLVSTLINGICMQIVVPTNNTTNVTDCKLVQTKPAQLKQLFSLKNETTGLFCLLAEFSTTVFVNGTTPQYLNLGTGLVNTTLSKCATSTTDPTKTLAIDFECGQMVFKVGGNGAVAVEDIHGLWFYGNKTNQTGHVDFNHEGNLFQTTKPGFYYRCDSEQLVHLNISNTPAVDASLLMSNVGIEDLTDTPTAQFYKPHEVCPLDAGPVNDLVPIAVGACLAALVVIVLIAYFVGRRRWSERSTYESV